MGKAQGTQYVRSTRLTCQVFLGPTRTTNVALQQKDPHRTLNLSPRHGRQFQHHSWSQLCIRRLPRPRQKLSIKRSRHRSCHQLRSQLCRQSFGLRCYKVRFIIKSDIICNLSRNLQNSGVLNHCWFTLLDGLLDSESSKDSLKTTITSSWTDFLTIAFKKEPMQPPKIFTNLITLIRNKWQNYWKKSGKKTQKMQFWLWLRVCFQWTPIRQILRRTRGYANKTKHFCWLIAPTISGTLDKRGEECGKFRVWQIYQTCFCWEREVNAWARTLVL